MPRLILCSDDFAFSRDVSETIAQLARNGKLNAISCMAAMPGWPADGLLLHDLPPQIEIGLHLTLTGERPLTEMPVLAPQGALPGINALHRAAQRRRLRSRRPRRHPAPHRAPVAQWPARRGVTGVRAHLRAGLRV